MIDIPSIGDTVHVRITNIIENKGAFVKMPNKIYGLIRTSDFAWFNQTSILNSFKIDDELDVKVTKILSDGKLELSRKAAIPNPRFLKKGEIVSGIITTVKEIGIIVKIGDFTALAHRRELPKKSFFVGEKISCVVVGNIFDENKHRNKISISILALHEYIAANYKKNAHIKCSYIKSIIENDVTYAIVNLNDLITLAVHSRKFIEPFKSKLLTNNLKAGDELEFVLSYNDSKRTISLDMRPIKEERKKENINLLRSQISIGDILEAKVLDVSKKGAQIIILNSNVESVISRDELSPNKVVRASDEVFKGEPIHVAYLGEENGIMKFSRKYLVKDKYSEKLYDMSLKEILSTMGIESNQFIGKAIEMGSCLFVSNLISIGNANEEANGRLLIDPINGKTLIAIIDNKLRNFFEIGEYYNVELSLADKEYRKKQGTPYMFSVVSNNITPTANLYKESVSLCFKQHTSPNTNTSVANLLEEVGKNLYSSKKRMFFELLQNADDASSENGVKVKLQLQGEYFVLTHDGYAFNQHDFESITSAAKSTKRANIKKTGYKGIGFKSVFTNSHSVLIKSGGYNFSFDKENSIYDDFKSFYFLVNDIVDDSVKQKEFLYKYAKFYRDFNGVKDIPWQLLPIWKENLRIEEKNSIFNQNENVAIALKMDEDTLSDYSIAIKEVFDEPRFMLFLRNTTRVQLMCNNEFLTIQKSITDNGKHISLINSFNPNNQKEDYSIHTVDNIIVDNSEFKVAGINVERRNRLNNRGDYEDYFIRVDEAGNELSEVSGIPDRIASTTDTTVSFAILLDSDNHIKPLDNDKLSLYAYLPMNEHRFKFPFYINADFIPKSDREGIQSDNPWNHFIFYIIGKNIVSMVASIASTEEPDYLNLLLSKNFKSDSQDTVALVDAFNRGYSEALSKEKFILNDLGVLVGTEEIIYDESGLSEMIGPDAFYELMKTNKRLVNKNLNAKILSKEIFCIEKVTVDGLCKYFAENSESLNIWIKSTDETSRQSFYSWIEKEEKTHDLISMIPIMMFGTEWKKIDEIKVENKYLFLTEKILPIKDILTKLGFNISNSKIENHPLYIYIYSQNEKDLFCKIQDCKIDILSFQERLSLYKNCINLEGVGKETIRKWLLFKNQNGEFAPLSSMFVYNEDVPEWLQKYMINIEECNTELLSDLVPAEEIFSSIIVPNINIILQNADLIDVYNCFKGSWTPSFTNSLFKKDNVKIESLLPIVEQTDADKSQYIRMLEKVNLVSNITYSKDSFEYRWIKLASMNSSDIAYARSIIQIDNKNLSEYTTKDELSITVDGNVCAFALSKILHSFSSASIISHIISCFSSIPGYEIIFGQNEASLTDVRNQLYNEIRTSTFSINEEQFCFLVAYRKNQGYSYFDNSFKPYIKIPDKELFLKILNRSMQLGIGGAVGLFIKSGGEFPFEKLVDTYFDCDEYTLERERTPSFITNWACSPERKKFLIQLGLHDNLSKEIVRRKSFKDGKNENIWNISDVKIIRQFLSWVAQSCDTPFSDENRVSILSALFNTLRIASVYKIDDFASAKEWSNNRYLEWKKTNNINIYIVEGKLPYRGIYANTYLYKGRTGEYTYFTETRSIYITSEKEPASVLANVYSDSKLHCPFSKDNWNEIFLVSADIVQEKDARIAELEEQLQLARQLIDAGAEVSKPGDYTERDNADENSRIELNREARLEAKDFLENMNDYDCSLWNPNDNEYIIKGKIRYKDKPIVVVVTSSRGRKLYLHPWAFAELMENPDNLLLNYGYDHKIHSLRFDDIFKDNPNVNLIFDMDVISPANMAELANKYCGSKNTCFVIENPKYSQSDAIKSFGLSEKKDNGFVNLNLSDIDIWG